MATPRRCSVDGLGTAEAVPSAASPRATSTAGNAVKDAGRSTPGLSLMDMHICVCSRGVFLCSMLDPQKQCSMSAPGHKAVGRRDLKTQHKRCRQEATCSARISGKA
eukprot:359159-Chlamydomonas_euryale.AAC.35